MHRASIAIMLQPSTQLNYYTAPPPLLSCHSFTASTNMLPTSLASYHIAETTKVILASV